MKRGPRLIDDGKSSWVRTPEDGVAALIIAVVELAKRDAGICLEELPIRERSVAAYQRAHARWFLKGLGELF